MTARKTPCATCIFGDGPRAVRLRPSRLGEIQGYLVNGTPHVCHTPAGPARRTLACRGGRDYQLMVWARLGLIAEPTDAALADAMAAAGVPPIGD